MGHFDQLAAGSRRVVRRWVAELVELVEGTIQGGQDAHTGQRRGMENCLTKCPKPLVYGYCISVRSIFWEERAVLNF